MKRTSLLIAVLLSLMASPAFAHLNPAEHGSFAAGFSHPLSGADHILAMVAVGLWASMLGGRALVVVPLSFVGVMLLGFMTALSGITLPYVEPVILTSVIVLGLIVAMAFHASTLTAALVVGFFAFFHGYAHGGEIGIAAFLSYGVGFALATALLHAAGIGAGLAAGRILQGRTGQMIMRAAGGFAALSGLYLMAG
ncbi:protein hupE [Ochrobactrum soli]|uniref:HupE/UreJ family protein n=1 Tax=Ochrobactrum soli TaxID=2448455 RepID=A0A849KHW1_9HYPH|nr:HupE/UreJ family protein [[Ochrobactrum] soli]MCI1000430.1 HupE/UreJ family protein [Ochrobactrum sp. C6C9]NNU60003.1 HupE/UreJ family protein [[Ochrobactrum] soli]RLL74488.1 protein hupE [[Ochrobactrum] soli]RRD26339.1 HupE/UreJ family protein [Brucellaceae bacterium VT-16-1752]